MGVPADASVASPSSKQEDQEIWRCVPNWNHIYEFSNHGKLRYANGGDKIKPLFIGPDGVLGFLMQKSLCAYLKPMHELYQETFPDLTKELEDKSKAV